MQGLTKDQLLQIVALANAGDVHTINTHHDIDGQLTHCTVDITFNGRRRTFNIAPNGSDYIV